MSLVIKRGMTGFFNGHWSFLTTVNGGLTGMVGTRRAVPIGGNLPRVNSVEGALLGPL